MKPALLLTAMLCSSGLSARVPVSENAPASDSTFEFIRDNLRIGQEAGEVLELLGDDYAEVMSIMIGAEMWRYDFPAEPGYTFVCPSGEDCVDIEGLESGRMAVQLFITWTGSGLLDDFTVYTGAGNGTVNEYRVFPDGSVRKTKI